MADRVETIGIYSAYGFAKEAGYTGTKAEFEQGLKNSAEYADNAASSANAATNAKNAAVTAKTDAQAAQSAAETAQGLAEDAQAAAEEAKNDAEAAAASLDASTIARIDGFYENMGVGTADQLMASQKVNDSDPYIFRTSGGTSDIGNREELEIVGGSIVWNQLYNGGDHSDVSKKEGANGGTTEIVDGILEFTIADVTTNNTYSAIIKRNVYIPAGHVVVILAMVNLAHSVSELLTWFTGTGTNQSRRLRDRSGNDAIEGNKWTAVGCVCKRNVDAGSYTVVQMLGRNPVTNGYSVGDVDKIDNIMFFDLTAMFGSTIADHVYGLETAEAGAGVAWFRKYFPNGYYEYNTGELMHVTDLQSHDTVGFNLWDEEWEKGSFNDDGSPKAASDRIRSKNFIKCFPKTTYKFSANTGVSRKVLFYDYDKKYISAVGPATSVNTFTTPSRCYYMKFLIVSSTMTGKNICINLSWSGTRDGEYEPYVKHSYPLDPSLTLRGIPELTADGDLTYNGDIYKPDGTVERRYGIVDLGTLTWTVQTAETGVFKSTNLSNLATPVTNIEIANIICYGFISSPASTPMPNNAIAVANSGTLYIKDSTYANVSAADFKAAMSGVYLVYELATLTSEQAEPYTSPQIVDDWGTEEFVTTSIVPVGHNTSYPANLRDKLQHLPDLPDDDGYYMTQVTGTQMSLIRFRIPQAPAEDGEYILKATVSNGTPTYTWEAVVEAEGGEG